MSGPGEGPGTEGLGYEQARTELREIVAKLESGGQSLEESLALWERGEQLAEICRRWLDGAGARLESAIAAHDAQPDAEPAAVRDEGENR